MGSEVSTQPEPLPSRFEKLCRVCMKGGCFEVIVDIEAAMVLVRCVRCDTTSGFTAVDLLSFQAMRREEQTK